MEQADLDALLTAHGGRAQPVASLHVLRGRALGNAEHAFLAEHAGALATVDLQRWLTRAGMHHRRPVIDALEQLAARDPGRFEHEIARAPHFGLKRAERVELAERLHGRVPESLLAALVPAPVVAVAAGPTRLEAPSLAAVALAAPPVAEGLFDPSALLSDLDFGGEAAGSGGAEVGAGFGDLLGDPDFFDVGERAPVGSLHPLLDGLRAELVVAKSPRGRADWKKRSLALAQETGEDWSPAVTELPREMRAAVLVRASVSPRPEERAALLEWLLQSGEKRAPLVGLTLGLVRMGARAQNVLPWLAETWIPKVLSDRSGWSRFGADVLGALVEQRAFSELTELFTAVVSAAGVLGPGLLALPEAEAEALSLRAPLFGAFSRMLVGFTGDAITAGNLRVALAGAATLASIGVPVRDVAAIVGLRRKRGAKGEVSTLLALAGRNARRAGVPPDLEDFVAAAHVLSDALTESGATRR